MAKTDVEVGTDVGWDELLAIHRDQDEDKGEDDLEEYFYSCSEADGEEEEVEVKVNAKVEQASQTEDDPVPDSKSEPADTSSNTKGALNRSFSCTRLKVHPLLDRFQDCFFDWMRDDIIFNRAEAITLTLVANSKYNRFTEAMMTKELREVPMETIGNHLIMSFYYIYLRDFLNVEEKMAKTAELIAYATENKLIALDHTEGLVYLFTGLHMYNHGIQLESATSPKSLLQGELALKALVDNAMQYSTLADGARSAIKYVKSFFMVSFRRLEEAANLLKEITLLEPQNIEWLVQYHTVLRLVRRDKNRSDGPSLDEKNAAIKCWRLMPSNNGAKLAVCTYMCDLIRSRQWIAEQGRYLFCPGLTFHDMLCVFRFVSKKSFEVIRDHPQWVKANLLVAEYFSSSLPKSYRDYRRAKRCFTNALTTNPDSSKAHHKFGIYLLVIERKATTAVEHFEMAYNADSRNFSALIDLTQAMMHDPGKYEKQLDSLFEEELDNEHWTLVQRSSLYGLFALYNFMNENWENCAQAWIKAHELYPESLKTLAKLSYQIKRYNWKPATVGPWLVDRLFVEIQKGEVNFEVSNPECLHFAHKYLVEGMDTVAISKSEGTKALPKRKKR